MARILLLEDRREEASKKIAFLESAGHSVDWVSRPSDEERAEEACARLMKEKYEFLVLDIFLEDKFGGIHIYNKLVYGDLRKRWTHTLIWSMYTGPRIKEATYGETEFPIRVFVETAGIYYENVFSSLHGGSAPILSRIAELSSLPPDRCHNCGADMSEDNAATDN